MLAYGIFRRTKSSATLKRAWAKVSTQYQHQQNRRGKKTEPERAARSTYALSIRSRLAVDLVPAENDEIRLLLVQRGTDEFQRPWVRLAPSPDILRVDIPTLPNARADVHVRHLHDLEFPFLADPRPRLWYQRWSASSYGQASLVSFARRAQQQCRVEDLPAQPSLDRVGPKQNIHGRDGLLRVPSLTFRRPLQPYPCRTRLPSLVALSFLACDGVQPADANVDDDLVLRQELLLSLPLHVNICARRPAGLEVQILFDSMPFTGIQVAAGDH